MLKLKIYILISLLCTPFLHSATKPDKVLLCWNHYSFDIIKERLGIDEHVEVINEEGSSYFIYQDFYIFHYTEWIPSQKENEVFLKEKIESATYFIENLVKRYSPKLLITLQTGGLDGVYEGGLNKIFQLQASLYQNECYAIPKLYPSGLPLATELYTDAFTQQTYTPFPCASPVVLLSSNSLGVAKAYSSFTFEEFPQTLCLAGVTDQDEHNARKAEREFDEHKWHVATEMIRYVLQQFFKFPL
jgi:hypothetical protein